MSADDEDKQDIIIVKRITQGDGHHGGAWKIAFADFMTAMMALFLVLWLVNAANEDMKKSVASYFNPVKLVDRNRSSKGLDKSAEASMKKAANESEENEAENPKPATPAVETASISDTAFFKDPFKVLDAIASEEESSSEVSEFMESAEQAGGAPAEDSFLDPFAQTESAEEASDFEGDGDANASPEISAKGPDDEVTRQTPRGNALESDGPAVQELVPANDGTMSPGRYPEQKTGNSDIANAMELLPENSAEFMRAIKEKLEAEKAEEEAEREERLKKISEEIGKDIKVALKKSLGEDEQLSESLTVEVTKDGVLISITDQFGFSMFQSGSAVPQGQLVLAMAEISTILSDKEGRVRIYGHTDAKPYAGKNYDNWRLSTARAHSARLMLARGGLDKVRVSQVVGFADRKLKEPERPEDEANRRIEILLEVS